MPRLSSIANNAAKAFGFGAAAIPKYIVATGGSIATDGDFKVHTFTGSSTFAVTQLSDTVSNTELKPKSSSPYSAIIALISYAIFIYSNFWQH